MASIAEKNGKWTVRWRDQSGAEKRRACPNKTTARALQKEVEETLALGRDWHPRDGAATPDLQVIFQAFLDDRARVLRPATIVQRHVALQLFLRHLRAKRPRGLLHPDLLTRAELGEFYTYMRTVRENTELSAAQRVRMIYYVWEWAFDHDEYGAHVGRPRMLDLPDASPVLKTAAPTWAQCDAVIAEASRSWAPWWARYLTVMRFTGLRKNQVIQLRWEDVDLDACTLRVRPELGKSKQERRGRVIPISPHLVAELAGWGVREAFLVETRGDKRRIDNETLHRIWKATGAPAEVWRQPLHAFRKALVSRLTEVGVAEHVVKCLVGHARGTTGDVYTEAAAMMPMMRAAVGLIPPVGGGVESTNVSAFRVPAVSQQDAEPTQRRRNK